MDAARLYAIVKDCQEVWDKVLHYEGGPYGSCWRWRAEPRNILMPDQAEFVLEAILARATGLGVCNINPSASGGDIHFTFARHGEEGATNHASRVEALASAYRQGVRAWPPRSRRRRSC